MSFRIWHDAAECTLMIRYEFSEGWGAAVMNLHGDERTSALHFMYKIRRGEYFYALEEFRVGTRQNPEAYGVCAVAVFVAGILTNGPTIKWIGQQARPGLN